MSTRKMVVYVDNSKHSQEVLEALKSVESEIKVVFRAGPSDTVPAVETRSGLIEGYENVCRYVLRNGK